MDALIYGFLAGSFVVIAPSLIFFVLKFFKDFVHKLV